MIAGKHRNRDRIAFICIGSDRSTGDSFGPLVGTKLQQLGWPHVIGTLEKPCDAHGVEHAVQTVSDDMVVIAIDACLGKPKSVGSYVVAEGPLQPGKAIGRRLPPIGHYSIAGVVNANGPKAYWMLQSTSLYHVLQMANTAALAVDAAWNEDSSRPATENKAQQICFI